MSVQNINVTPSFEQATEMWVVILLNGTPEGQRQAEAELLRYARELDRLCAASGSAFDPNDTAMEGE